MDTPTTNRPPHGHATYLDPAEVDSALRVEEHVSPELRNAIEQLLELIPLDSGGGATLVKALLLSELIVHGRLTRVVEIGVYRGRLLLPLALTAKWRATGEVIGIDPYSAQAAEQHDAHACSLDLKKWPHEIDWDGVYTGVHSTIVSHELQRWCRVLRQRSEDAAQQFATESIDLLHIDGNHDRASVIRDVELYLPKVKTGGYIVLDDASWSSVWPAYRYLQANHELVFQLLDCRGVTANGVGGNDFAVFRIIESAL
jgi:hypothetical protein